MAGFFAAAAKTPFSTVVIVTEMTGGYHLLLPAMWVCLISFIISDRQSIYRSQVEGRSFSPAHHGSFVRQILAGIRVSQFLKPQSSVPVLHLDDSLETVINKVEKAGFPALPVLDREGRLAGVVDLEEIHLASQRHISGRGCWQRT